MSVNDNPINIVHAAMWELAETSVALSSLVRPANRIKFAKPTYNNPQKTQIGDGDLPELALFIKGINGKLRSNSSGSELTINLSWVISTGSFGIEEGLAPISFALYAAMAEWPSRAMLLTWKDKPFIKRCDLQDAQFGLLDAQQNRSIQGWSAVWSMEVFTHLSTADLITFNGEL